MLTLVSYTQRLSKGYSEIKFVQNINFKKSGNEDVSKLP